MEGMQGHQSLVSDSGLGLAVIYYAFSSAWNFDVFGLQDVRPQSCLTTSGSSSVRRRSFSFLCARLVMDLLGK